MCDRTTSPELTLQILTPKRNPSDPLHWVLLYGPHKYSPRREPHWQFIDIFSGPSGYRCSSKTKKMHTYFMLAIWQSCQHITTVDHFSPVQLHCAVNRAIAQAGHGWFAALLRELAAWGWLDERARQLESNIPVKEWNGLSAYFY
ncbi:hypothetical protein BDW62DRAFT_203713 [Aspergillus aurantiobrunneus]